MPNIFMSKSGFTTYYNTIELGYRDYLQALGTMKLLQILYPEMHQYLVDNKMISDLNLGLVFNKAQEIPSYEREFDFINDTLQKSFHFSKEDADLYAGTFMRLRESAKDFFTDKFVEHWNGGYNIEKQIEYYSAKTQNPRHLMFIEKMFQKLDSEDRVNAAIFAKSKGFDLVASAAERAMDAEEYGQFQKETLYILKDGRDMSSEIIRE